MSRHFSYISKTGTLSGAQSCSRVNSEFVKARSPLLLLTQPLPLARAPLESLNQSTMSGDGNTSSQSVDALLDELKEFCQSDSLYEDGLREIIGRHGVAPNNVRTSVMISFFWHAAMKE